MSFCALSDAKGMIINMKISSKLAQNIVQSIKEIIHHEINFMNMEGVIIASTDPVRIGQQHEGALKVLKTKRSLSVKNDDEFKGTKKGINLPLYFEEEIIAVVASQGIQRMCRNMCTY